MASVDTVEEFDPEFREFNRTQLDQIPGGTGSPDFLALVAELSELEREEPDVEGTGYHTDVPPQSEDISFPLLLSNYEKLTMSREELEIEIVLILEMRTGDAFDTGTALYSVASILPATFSIPEPALDDLSELPAPVRSNARAGYLIHDDLYSLQSDPNKLHDLISVFLWECEEVGIKLKRRGDAVWRTVKVRLAS